MNSNLESEVITINQGDSISFEDRDIAYLKLLKEKIKNELNEEIILLKLNEKILKLVDNYVGVLEIPSKTIVILPKSYTSDLESLLRIYFFTRRNTDLKTPLIPSFSITSSNFLIDITNEYITSLSHIIQRGLILRYINKLESIRCIKGKINLKQQMRTGNFFGSTIYCNFDEMLLNHKINQIIVFCIEKLSKIISDKNNRARLARLRFYFQNISIPIKITIKDFEDIKLLSYESYYEKILELSKIIIFNLFYSKVGNTLQGNAFLIDFNKLFEDFIKTIFLKYSNGFSYWQNEEDYGYYHEYPRTKTTVEYPKTFKPDILFDYNPITNRCEAIIDVKNKYDKPFQNPDIFQLYFYSKKLNASKAFLIYPSSNNKKSLKITIPFDTKPEIFAVWIDLSGSGNDFWKNINNFKNTVDNLIYMS